MPTRKNLTIHSDSRGAVREAYRASWFPGVPPVVQVVQSDSKPGVLRAMHAHKRQYDIWHFTQGVALVQLFDHRTGYHWGGPLDSRTTLVIPPGVSHGFLAKTAVQLTYYLTEEYDGSDEFGWDPRDPDFPGRFAWDAQSPIKGVIQSERDKTAPSLAAFMEAW
jgi:dTDP-4-dehydrorhamnose 3,5-epimerase-like enzyme